MIISKTGGGPVIVSDFVTGSLTQEIILFHKFEIKSPNSPSSIIKCTNVFVFIILATLSLETKSDYVDLSISLISPRPGTLLTLRRTSNNYSSFDL